MLQIPDRFERTVVSAADVALKALAGFRRAPVTATAPTRILLLRLERIGDLVMALDAIRDVRQLAPSAQIDLVVGSWNAKLAEAVPSVDRVEVLDARWLARGDGGLAAGGGALAAGGRALGVPGLVRAAWGWRSRGYDLGINFEPDVRSNLVLAAAGAARTVGWRSGGGGPVLDVSLDYDQTAHTAVNARRLVAAAFGGVATESSHPLLTIPETAAARAAARLRSFEVRQGPIVGMHVSGGRAIKQWDPSRFAEVAMRLADERSAHIVLTGAPGDRPLVDQVKTRLASRSCLDVSGHDDLLDLGALLQRLDLFVTGDTGPMHLAAAVGTPVVAVFGPSAPERYAPSGPCDRIVRVDLPCSPCNRIRRPPERCVGHTPDCLVGVSVEAVYSAATSALEASPAGLSRARRS